MIRALAITLVFSAAPAAVAALPSESGRGPIMSNFAIPNDIERRLEELAAEFDPPEHGTYADLPMLTAPVVENGRMVAYAFVRPRVRLGEGLNDAEVHRNAHIILDRYIKSVHAHPFERTGNEAFDRAAAQERLLAVTREVVGEGAASLELLGGDMRLMRRR
jgi:hypothetical protein